MIEINSQTDSNVKNLLIQRDYVSKENIQKIISQLCKSNIEHSAEFPWLVNF